MGAVGRRKPYGRSGTTLYVEVLDQALNSSMIPSNNESTLAPNAKIPAGKTPRRSTYIPRVVVEQVYQGPCKIGAREYNENKREFAYLFSEFSAEPAVVKARRANIALNKQRAEEARLAKLRFHLRPLQSGVTSAQICARRCNPGEPAPVLLITGREAREDYEKSLQAFRDEKANALKLVRAIAARFHKKEAKATYLRYRMEARRDYSRAFEELRQQQQFNLELVNAIAARHAIVIRHQRDSCTLVNDRQVREARTRLNRERKYLARHPAKEVKDFGPFAYYDTSFNLPEDKVVSEPLVKRPRLVRQERPKRDPNYARFMVTEKWLLTNRFYKKQPPTPILSKEEVGFLKFKCQLKRKLKRDPLAVESFFNRVMCRQTVPLDVPRPQMEGTGEIQDELKDLIQKSNVVIASASQSEQGLPPGFTKGFASLSVTQMPTDFDRLSDRWLMMQSFDWTTTADVNDVLYQKSYPFEIMAKAPNSQMAQLLFTSRLFRTDLEFKVVCNTSPWMTGMVVVDWCYGSLKGNENVQNVFTAIQRNHCFINAGSSNNGQLVVPYHHFNDYLSTATKMCSFGYLTVRVLNPLTTVDTVATKGSITVYVALKDFDPHGLVDRSIGVAGITRDGVQGQMLPIAKLCNAGSSVLRTAGNILNQDEPPLPLQPVSFIPQTIPSFAYLEGLPEPINVLRADPRGQRVPSIVTRDMQISTLTDTWGFLQTINWSFNDVPGAKLAALEAKPLFDNTNKYPGRVAIEAGLYAAVLPPVSAACCMASKVRGNLEFKLQFVANAFYTGAIQVSIIPLATQTDDYDIYTAGQSATQIIDVQQTTQVALEVPWNWYNAWMRTPSYYHTGNTFAMVYIHVVNALVGIEKVPPNLRINVYVKGGSGFELSQLRTPMYSISNKVLIPPHNQYLEPYNFENAWYATWNRNIGKESAYLITPYIQNVSDGWVGYVNVKPRTVYLLADMLSDNKTFFRFTDHNYVQYKFGVYHSGLATGNAHGLAVFKTIEAAKFLIQKQIEWGDDGTLNGVVALKQKFPSEVYDTDGPWSQIKGPGDADWRTADNVAGYPIWTEVKGDVSSPFEVVDDSYQYFKCVPIPSVLRGQGDGQMLSTEPSPSTSGMGRQVFGESFTDLKGIARCWQHYGSFEGTTCASRNPRDCPYSFKFPVMPSRVLQPKSSASYDNRVREGTISLINSMFAFWEGGMRYRLVATHDIPNDAIVYVAHRQDEEPITVEGIVKGGVIQDGSELLDTHYRTFAQALKVNPVLSIEVPYYRTESRLRTVNSETGPCHNGFLYVWVHTPIKTNIHFEIYYAVADDFQWSIFQGVPPLMSIRSMAPEPRPQMDDKPSEEMVDAITAAGVVPGEDKPSTSEEPQGSAVSKVSTTIENVDEAAKGLAEASKAVIDTSDNANDALKKAADTAQEAKSILSKIKGFLPDFSTNPLDTLKGIGGKAFDYLTHIVYCIINPNGPTIAWALINIYRQVFGLTFEGFSRLSELICDLWKRACSAIQRTQPKAQAEDTDISSLCSILYTAFASYTQLKVRPPDSWVNISEGLFRFSSYCRGGQWVGSFILDNLRLVKKVWEKFISRFAHSAEDIGLVAGINDTRLSEWCIHSQAMLNPAIREVIQTQPAWAEKVFSLAIAGRALLYANTRAKRVNPEQTRFISTTLSKLQELEQDLINRKVFSGVRYEPWVLWFQGEHGAGKSRLLNKVAEEYVRRFKIPVGHPYFSLTMGQAYFDAYVGQPTILIDDFLATSPATDTMIPTYLQMKSSALFNPPYSDVKDKSKLVNFHNLFISSNFAGFHNKAGIHDEGAYNRRRDCLIKVVKVKPTQEWTLEQYEACEHVRLFHCQDVMDPTISQIEILREGDRPYVETIMDYLMARASEYHTKSSKKYQLDCEIMIKRLDDLARETMSVSSYIESVEKTFKDDKMKVTDLLSFWKCKRDFVVPVESPLTGDKEPKGQGPDPDAPPPLTKFEEETAYYALRGEEKGKVYPYCRIRPTDNLMVFTYMELPGMQHYIYGNPYCQESLDETRQYKDCLHKLAIPKLENYSFDPREGKFINYIFDDSDTQVPPSFTACRCFMLNISGKIEDYPGCIYGTPEFDVYQQKMSMAFLERHEVWRGVLKAGAHSPTKWKDLYESVIGSKAAAFPYRWVMNALANHWEKNAQPPVPKRNSKLEAFINKWFRESQEDLTKHGDRVFFKDSPFKWLGQKAWKAFLFLVDAFFFFFTTIEGIVITLFSLCAAFMADRYFFSNEQPEGQLHPSGDYQTIKNRPGMRLKALNLVKPEGADKHLSPEEIAVLMKQLKESNHKADGRLDKIVNNIISFIGVSKDSNGLPIMTSSRCIGLRGYEFLVLKHYVETFKAKNCTHVIVVWHGLKGVVQYKIEDLAFKWFDKGGYGIGLLPSGPRMFADITAFMPCESFSGSYPDNMFLVTVDPQAVRCRDLRCTKIPEKGLYVPAYKEQTSWTIPAGFEYPFGGSGFCGSFVYAPELGSPLVAIHSAGIDDRQGFAELLVRESFTSEVPVVDYVEPQMKIDENKYDPPGDCYLVGHLPPQKAVHGPKTTRIEPSVIAGVFPIQTTPAPLDRKDPRIFGQWDPLDEGIKKRCIKTPDFPRKFLEQAYEHLRDKIMLMRPLRIAPQRLSLQVAVNGCELKGYEGIEMSTSEGYPWVLDRPKGISGKSWLFQMEQKPDGTRDLVGIQRDLMQMLDVKEEMRKQLVCPVTYFTACLKDARIPLEKIKKPGCTRLFEMSPVDLTIAQRQYYLDFYTSYQSARLDMENTIGINPDGPEWTELANRLTSWSQCILTADYSGYGPRLLHSVQWKAYCVEMAWYWFWQSKHKVPQEQIEEEFDVRYTMAVELINHFNVVGDAVIMYPTGMPSGNAATVIKNSECNSLYIRVIYLYLAHKYCKCYADLYWFSKFVLMFSNGDDLIISVKEEIISWFNNRTLIEGFADFDIKMTDALKSGIVREYCTLEEATYLKRGFMRHPKRDGQWLAPLEENSITDTANWIWRNVDPLGASFQNSEMAARLAYTRGPKFYEYVVHTLRDAWMRKGKLFEFPSWDSLDSHVWEGTEGPVFSYA